MLLLPVLATAAIAAGPPALERMPLFTPAELKAWSTAESTVAVSTDRTHDGAPTLHWHVTVDYQTGEPKYPIGWPRVSRGIPAGPLRDWTKWDYLHAWVFVASSRDKLPAIPAGLGLHTPDRAGAFQRTLTELRVGQWVELKLPITQIPRAHDVRQIQFHIAEQNYRDGDQLDFQVSDFALVRYAAPTILDFAPESAVLYADAAQIPLRLHLAGVPEGAATALACELHREARKVAAATLRGTRGSQIVALPLDRHRLAPGEYELRAVVGGGTSTATARVRLVSTPWK
ncbi:MAG: hypothetical protein HZC55_26360 [Verrucomicrobia bacterium]|nr:hypothetical protein [Verrucomicrobiota bacterium]